MSHSSDAGGRVAAHVDKGILEGLGHDTNKGPPLECMAYNHSSKGCIDNFRDLEVPSDLLGSLLNNVGADDLKVYRSRTLESNAAPPVVDE